MRPSTIAGSMAAAAALGAGYAVGIERMSPRLRYADVPVLAPGSRPLRVLHFSDLHFTPSQRWKRDFVRSLGPLEPDLVVNTGDSIAHEGALPIFLDAVEPLLDRPGVFVLGSNDYYAPRLKNPASYLFPDDGSRLHGPELPWRDLCDAMTSRGWLDLDNARGRIKADERDVEVIGTNDSHIQLDDYASVAGAADSDADLRIGVVHSPEPRLIDAITADGFDLVFAGHTHGGQLRVPFYGALVTNCGLDRKRARGLSRWDGGWLHVSAGLGTSPTAPARFACPPEATLLTLVATE